MGRVTAILMFVAATALAFFGFAPAGGVLGETVHGFYASMVAGGTPEMRAALIPLLTVDLIFIAAAFLVSFAGGVHLPSGLPHVFFVLFTLLTLGATQVRFFELAGPVGGLADTFGTYNIVAMFALSIAAVQLGVHLARRRFEARTR